MDATLEKTIRATLHDMSNALTVLVGRAELMAQNSALSQTDRKDIEEILKHGQICFALMDKARQLFNQNTAGEGGCGCENIDC